MAPPPSTGPAAKHNLQYLLNAEPASNATTSTRARALQCPTCGKGFTRTGDLTKHQRNVHEGEQRHVCMHCGKRFSEKGNLNKHVQRFHTDVKKYSCQACRKSFSTSDALLRHGRQVHGR